MTFKLEDSLKNFEFHFKGEVPSSKSLLNRALIMQSYFPELEIQGTSQADDVVHLSKALQQFQRVSGAEKAHFYCGEGGTTLRFLVLRLSRRPGAYLVRATPQLLARPQSELIELLRNLGVSWTQLSDDVVRISSPQGWVCPQKPLRIRTEISSQFLSALILNSWNLPFDMYIETSGLDYGYLKMTFELLQSSGMKFEIKDGDHSWVPLNSKNPESLKRSLPEQIRILSGQHLATKKLIMEPDLSSAFVLAALGALHGSTLIKNFPMNSTQPDLAFLDILAQMGAEIKFFEESTNLYIQKKQPLRGGHFNLGQCPDLFPVLAATCALCQGPSKLFGAPQLIYKESNRIARVSELLDLFNIPHTPLSDGMELSGRSHLNSLTKESASRENSPEMEFDPTPDHRLAMAGLVLKLSGYPIVINNLSVLNKSFPELPEILKGSFYEKHS